MYNITNLYEFLEPVKKILLPSDPVRMPKYIKEVNRIGVPLYLIIRINSFGSEQFMRGLYDLVPPKYINWIFTFTDGSIYNWDQELEPIQNEVSVPFSSSCDHF